MSVSVYLPPLRYDAGINFFVWFNLGKMSSGGQLATIQATRPTCAKICSAAKHNVQDPGAGAF